MLPLHSPVLSLSLNSVPSMCCGTRADLHLLGTFLPSLSPGCPQPELAWPCPDSAMLSLALAALFIPLALLGTCPRVSLCLEGLGMVLGHQHRGSRG